MGDGRLYVAFLGTARERLRLAPNGGVSSRSLKGGWFDTADGWNWEGVRL